MAVASAGPYANNLHLAPDRQPHQHLITHFLQAGCSSWRPTNSVKALIGCRQSLVDLNYCCWSVRHGIGWNQLSHDIMLNWLLQLNGSRRPHHSCHLANADNAEIYCTAGKSELVNTWPHIWHQLCALLVGGGICALHTVTCAHSSCPWLTGTQTAQPRCSGT